MFRAPAPPSLKLDHVIRVKGHHDVGEVVFVFSYVADVEVVEGRHHVRVKTLLGRYTGHVEPADVFERATMQLKFVLKGLWREVFQRVVEFVQS